MTAARIWVVATSDTTKRWSRALRDAALDPVELPWGTVVAGPDCDSAPAWLSSDDSAWVVIPSASALRFLPSGAGEGRHVACVGPHTANAAVARGFVVGLVGAADGASLAQQLASGPGPKHAVILRSAEGRDDVERVLREAGWAVTSKYTYAVEASGTFAEQVREAPEPRAVVHGSPHGVRALEQALAARSDLDLSALSHVAVGETTAHALRDAGCARVAVADRPSALALVATVQRVVVPQEL